MIKLKTNYFGINYWVYFCNRRDKFISYKKVMDLRYLTKPNFYFCVSEVIKHD